MEKLPLTFEELTTDRDGNASKAAFVSLANELIDDGRHPYSVFRAMLRAAYEASISHSISEHYTFVVEAAWDTADWKEQAKKMIDASLNTPEAKAFFEEIDIENAIKEAEAKVRG